MLKALLQRAACFFSGKVNARQRGSARSGGSTGGQATPGELGMCWWPATRNAAAGKLGACGQRRHARAEQQRRRGSTHSGMEAWPAGQEDRRRCPHELAWVGGGAAHSGMVVRGAWEATVAGQGGPKAVPARACVVRRRGHGREARVRDGES